MDDVIWTPDEFREVPDNYRSAGGLSELPGELMGLSGERGRAVHSVLGSVGSRRRSTTSTALLNASAFGLQGYMDTLSPLVAMHLIDRSCVIVGNFFEILCSPTVASEIIVILLTSNVLL